VGRAQPEDIPSRLVCGGLTPVRLVQERMTPEIMEERRKASALFAAIIMPTVSTQHPFPTPSHEHGFECRGGVGRKSAHLPDLAVHALARCRPPRT
jgi:hypothetical protein